MPEQIQSSSYEAKHAAVKRRRIISPLSRLALHNFNTKMYAKMTEVRDPVDRELVTASQEGRSLIKNDGTRTYVVHSTTPERAKRALEEGLRFKGKDGNPDAPDLRETGYILAGPKERLATERNIDSLAYRYGDHGSSIKLVYEFDTPNPGTSRNDDPFQGTFLDHADGANVQQLGGEGDGSYVLPPERLKGYFDLDSGEFVANPQFGVTSGEPAMAA